MDAKQLAAALARIDHRRENVERKLAELVRLRAAVMREAHAQGMTLEQIGDVEGISRERVRQIIKE